MALALALQRFLDSQFPDDLPDAVLLAGVVARKDEAAFAALVRRHGPMILGVCRRLLGDTPEAEDAFQATFLVLLAKAGGLTHPDQLAGWLHNVARRCALKALRQRQRQRRRQKRLDELPVPSKQQEEDAFLRAVLDEEIAALPHPFREAVLCCWVEGATRATAARQLGVAEGTVGSRLARARERLQARLRGRGIELGVVTLTAAVSRALLAQTMVLFRAYGLAGSSATLPIGVAGLTQGVLLTMQLSMLKKASLVGVLLLSGIGFGGWIVAQEGGTGNPAQGSASDNFTETGEAERLALLTQKRVPTSIEDRLEQLEAQARQMEDQAFALLSQAKQLRSGLNTLRLAMVPRTPQDRAKRATLEPERQALQEPERQALLEQARAAEALALNALDVAKSKAVTRQEQARQQKRALEAARAQKAGRDKIATLERAVRKAVATARAAEAELDAKQYQLAEQRAVREQREQPPKALRFLQQQEQKSQRAEEALQRERYSRSIQSAQQQWREGERRTRIELKNLDAKRVLEMLKKLHFQDPLGSPNVKLTIDTASNSLWIDGQLDEAMAIIQTVRELQKLWAKNKAKENR